MAGPPRADDVVEVLASVSDDVAPAVAPSVVTRAARSSWSWLRSRRPRQLVAGALVVALGVTVGAVADVRRAQERDQRIALAPGGVFDLSTPVGERWSHELPAQDWSDGFKGHWIEILAVLDGDTAVVAQPVAAATEERREDGALSRSLDVHGWDLRGIDLETGEARRTHHLPGSMLDCTQRIGARAWMREGSAVLGPQGPDLACLAVERAELTVSVQRADGTVTERPIVGLGEHTSVAIGPHGTLWIVDRVDGEGTLVHPEIFNDLVVTHYPATGPDGDGAGTGLEAADPAAPLLVQDVRLIVQDARTGERMWEQTLPPDPQAGSCTAWGNGLPRLDPHGVFLWWGNHPDAMVVHGCGVALAVSAAGEILHDNTGRGVWAIEARPLADGGVLRTMHDETGVAVSLPLADRQGRPVALRDLWDLLDPWTTDGLGGVDLSEPPERRDPQGRLFWRQGVSVVIATDMHGDELWQTRREHLVRSVVAARATSSSCTPPGASSAGRA